MVLLLVLPALDLVSKLIDIVTIVTIVRVLLNLFATILLNFGYLLRVLFLLCLLVAFVIIVAHFDLVDAGRLWSVIVWLLRCGLGGSGLGDSLRCGLRGGLG